MLKQFVFGMVFCTALIGVANAQANNLQFGIKGGLGFSEISGSTLDKTPRLGIQLGGVMTQKISDSLSMQYEALYSQKGIVENQTVDDVNYKFETNIDYLEIPVFAKFKVAEKWAVYGGGYVGWALSKKVKITAGSISSDVDIDKFVNDLDYGMLLGVQAQLAERWAVDARYTLGLTDVFTSGDSKNSTIAISATYLL